MAGDDDLYHSELLTALRKLINDALKSFRFPLSQSTGTIPPTQLPPAGGSSGGGVQVGGVVLEDGTPAAVATSGSAGSSGHASRGDHAHAHGNQAGGSEHAAATTSTAGFATLAASGGTTAGTVVQATDSRLSDARTPTAHHTTHQNGGSDEVATATAAANAIPKAGSGGKLDKAWMPDFVASGASHASGGVPDPGSSAGSTKFLREDASWATPSGTGMSNPMTTQDDIIVGGASGTPTRLAKGSDSQVLTVDPTTHHLVWATPSSGFSDPTTTKGDLIVHGSSTTRLGVGSDGQVLTADSAQSLGVKWATAAAGTPSHAYFTKLAALLEPDALEPLNSGSFSYAVGSGVTKYLIASYKTQLAGAGRMELRNPQNPMPLSNVTLSGIGSDSAAWTLDPTLPSYTDAWTKYYDRLNAIASLTTRQVTVTASNTRYPFLMGAYGGFIVNVTSFDFTWIALMWLAAGVNSENEISDSTTQRIGTGLYLPVSKKVVSELLSGTGVGGDSGAVAFVLVPSTWSAVTDPNTYIFRDDFMGSSLDTTTNWTRAQSTAGNVEIDTTYQWCKAVGNANWGTNSIYSKTSTSRANNKRFMCDVYMSRTGGASLIVGWSDGAGHSYTNFCHGLLFGTGNTLTVYEAGTSRGNVGSGFSNGGLYRVRITLGSSNNAKYEVQGGSEYPALGGSSWTDVTPGTTSNSTTPLYAGVSIYDKTNYVSDVRLFT